MENILQKTSLNLNYFKFRLEVLKPVIERFLNKISVLNSGCWKWTGYTNYKGYGTININKVIRRVHRVMYEYFYGELNPSLDIHHKCKNRSCVNPLHLEQITHKENNLKSNSFSAVNSRKTYCIRGHEFTTKNTYVWITLNGDFQRHCRVCHNKQNTLYLKRKNKVVFRKEEK